MQVTGKRIYFGSTTKWETLRDTERMSKRIKFFSNRGNQVKSSMLCAVIPTDSGRNSLAIPLSVPISLSHTTTFVHHMLRYLAKIRQQSKETWNINTRRPFLSATSEYNSTVQTMWRRTRKIMLERTTWLTGGWLQIQMQQQTIRKVRNSWRNHSRHLQRHDAFANGEMNGDNTVVWETHLEPYAPLGSDR